jgi:3-oxoacyl-[acyl-carrier protein] reductase
LSHTSPFDLAGKVVVVTGGASGIGMTYSQAIANAGGAVVLADLDGDLARAEAKKLSASGADVLGLGVDIADEAALTAMADGVAKRYGRVDGLVNNAALMSTLPRRNWMDIPTGEWAKVMQVNLGGLFLTCRAVYPLMRERGGSIINISSTRALDGTPNRLHYTTSKAGSLGFTRALAREVGGDAIRVNAIAPGITLSDTQIASSDPQYLADLSKGRALTRNQGPQDLVGAVLFLLSDASSFVTGQTLVVDGGKVMN